jgi:cytochrome c551/c552
MMQIRPILRNLILTLLCLLLLVACASQPEPVEAPVEEATEAPVEEATEAPAEEATEEPVEEEPVEEVSEEPVEEEPVEEGDTDAEYGTESEAADESEAAEDEGTEEVALQLLEQYGCLSCHRYADLGSFVGPDLDDMGAKYEADFIRESIVEPAAVLADGAVDLMPDDYGDKISEEDLTQIVEFLVASTGE